MGGYDHYEVLDVTPCVTPHQCSHGGPLCDPCTRRREYNNKRVSDLDEISVDIKIPWTAQMGLSDHQLDGHCRRLVNVMKTAGATRYGTFESPNSEFSIFRFWAPAPLKPSLEAMKEFINAEEEKEKVEA